MRKAIGILLLALIAGLAIMLGCLGRREAATPLDDTAPARKERSPFVIAPHDGPAVAIEADETASRIKDLCSTCHVLPPPDVEPKSLWPDKIREMYQYAQGPRPIPPERLLPIEEVIDYWTFRAPEYLAVPEGAMGSPPSPHVFQRRVITLDAIPPTPSISSVRFVDLVDDAPIQLLICDMRHGLVVLWKPSRSGDAVQVLAEIPHPSHTRVVDLDGDGLRDVLVANLGDYWPVDIDTGSVVWLRGRGGGQFEKIDLATGMGRVNDVQPADFDADGDLDLVVADFGNLTTGRIIYLENLTEDYSEPVFEPLQVEAGAGTSDVPIVDLNEDGLPDFVALQSQEKERVVAFLNLGWGYFRPRTIYQAPHPRWGSIGIRLIDLDGDQDVDMLLNNGDSVQIPPIPRPYHGLGWLENQGKFSFVYHRLAQMPGAHTSMPGDLDGDGDLDLVSSAFIPVFNPEWQYADQLDSIVWLEQTSPGQYERYSLETGKPYHPCGDLGDYDGDGDLDIVLGNFYMFPGEDDTGEGCLTIMENRQIAE